MIKDGFNIIVKYQYANYTFFPYFYIILNISLTEFTNYDIQKVERYIYFGSERSNYMTKKNKE